MSVRRRRGTQTSKGETASEAAYELGRLESERGHQATALEWFTTAVSAAPDSPWGRLALLGSGDALAALDQNPEALAAYEAARRGAGRSLAS